MRVPLADATAIADELVAQLRPGTERIEVGGSIRRKRQDIGDIELVAVPRIDLVRVPGLFEDKVLEQDALELLIDTLLIQGTLEPHPTDPKRGDRYAKLIHAKSRLQVDLFKARRYTFGLIWLIRTGPAEYSRHLVTVARERGHHVAGGELHEGHLGCSATPCTVVPTPEEADVYQALGAHYIEPEDRK
jgi:DNA polymerase/3'-5' exonuclease PolX